MNRIKLLDTNLINQIAAGEVIERPASVVKELVENSVDAGATKISIEITNECRDIRIADNGTGIHKDDMVLAFSRHATSKIAAKEDLWKISTLGFRGEALASIISVSKVSCTSKTKDSASGYRAECENSEVKIAETGCAQGTIMEVKDLFYNTPVRLKFIKKNQTEFAYILEIIQSIAISHPEVSFALINNNHTSLKTTGSGDIETVISEVYSKDMINELVTISLNDQLSQMTATGVASTPEFTRSNKKAIYLFVNGRTVKCPVILKAIDNAYRDLIPNERYPFVVLNLKIKPDEVDVNVHPSKKEIRYINTNLVFGFVNSAIRNALQNVINQSTNKFSNVDKETIYFENKKADLFSQGESKVIKEENYSFGSLGINYQDKYEGKTATIEEPISQISLNMQDVSVSENIQKVKIIGQLMNTYILIEEELGLQVIDQHIAHERYLYEQLKDKLSHNEQIASQLLFTSEIIALEPYEAALIAENEDSFEKLGYKISLINEKEVIFKQIPMIIAGKNPEKIINELIDILKNNKNNITDEILISTACHAAIKAGERLSIWQMEELIKKWQTCKHPQTCPHGRIISHIVPIKEIAGFFGRSV